MEGSQASSGGTMETTCYVVSGFLLFLLFLHSAFEVHYFLRMFLCAFVARCKRRVGILSPTSVYGMCITTDIDTLLYHMNNARYIRELDFARVDFYERSGLYRKIREKGGAVVQGAATIRYRRFLRPFTLYKITSKVVYWDDKSVFMEHRFITPKDGFIRAIAVCRQRVINANAEDVMRELILAGEQKSGKKGVSPAPPGSPPAPVANGNAPAVMEGGLIQRPPVPLEIAKWIECNDISSANLRNGC
ncbi:protein THEM6 [Ischnura elegans]|uniref:protein THEM6 n=1 Tax=Ischnura elegans TaxID=197161 RepID=UPI001ED88643|nr:protein THEM6 [Ischnura elegans]XP_046394088.1 protein THEM6 [Ischnura elegans]